MRMVDLTGQTFGQLTVIDRAKNRKGGEARWNCACNCGGSTTATGSNLRLGRTTSCGCAMRQINRERKTTHGGHGTPEYGIWCSMIRRCENKNDDAYPRYGGRGITVHPEWRADFAAFLRDVGRRPSPDLSLDRIDNDRGYEPGNIRWATAKQQANNRRKPTKKEKS